MTQHQELREALGLYLLGACSATETVQVERHLESCGDCRAELARLAAVVPVLKGEPSAALMAEQLPPKFVDRLGARVARERARRRRRRLLGGGVAVAVAAAAAAALAVAPWAKTSPSVAFRPTSALVHASGTIAYQSKPWGTQLVLRMNGLPVDYAFIAYVQRRQGTWLEVGSWRGTDGGQEVVEAAAMVPLQQMRGVVVETTSGQRLLWAPSP